jgi:hypothetical protein
MKYLKSNILRMSEECFSNIFNNKNVIVLLLDDSSVEGMIVGIVLASNVNSDTKDHLPVAIKVSNNNIRIDKIKSIEIISTY